MVFLAALFPLNPLLSSRYDPLIMCFFPLYFLLYSSFIFWKVDGKNPSPFFSICRFLMLLFLLCWPAPETTLQNRCLALTPEIPLPSVPCPFWFLYHLLFTVICTKLACFLSLSVVILIIQNTILHSFLPSQLWIYLPPSWHEPSDNFLQQPAFFSTVIGRKGSPLVLFSLPV